jgi:hypothetical protein
MGMPGIGELMEGAMQQAPQLGRQVKGMDGVAWRRCGILRLAGAGWIVCFWLEPDVRNLWWRHPAC